MPYTSENFKCRNGLNERVTGHSKQQNAVTQIA